MTAWGSAPAAPMKIEIVNAKDVFSPAKILSVKRDNSGKLSGATIEPVAAFIFARADFVNVHGMHSRWLHRFIM